MSDRDWRAEIADIRRRHVSYSEASEIRDALIDALAARLQEVEGGWRYPHMCRDEHKEIGHADSESEMCPVCTAIADRDAAREEAADLQQQIESRTYKVVGALAARCQELEGERDAAREEAARLRGLLGEAATLLKGARCQFRGVEQRCSNQATHFGVMHEGTYTYLSAHCDDHVVQGLKRQTLFMPRRSEISKLRIDEILDHAALADGDKGEG